jgi:two-component system, OmpR family, phosphate regulon sensor histidine kinase PhoR
VVTKAIEHIRTLQDIANEKSRMRTMINHLADGVMATDARKQVALSNHAFLNLVGYHGSGPIGLPVENAGIGQPHPGNDQMRPWPCMRISSRS